MIVSKLSFLLYFSFLYIIGLIILYYSKARVHNLENRIYKWLLGLNLLGILLQILCDLVSKYYNLVPELLSSLILSLFLAYFIGWINTMLDYLLAISYPNKRPIIWVNIALTVVEAIIVLCLPYELYSNRTTGIYYTYGPAIDVSFTISGILMGVMFILLLINAAKIKKTKVIPIFLFLVFGIIAAIIQKNNPSIIIIAPVETFLCSLMYFTIENPDLKMIQQLELAKEQADKANHAKTDFLSSMSHEIRTPLNAIVGFSNEIADAKDLEEAKSNAKDIVSASDTLLEIVNGILDISKIEAGKFEIVCSPYNAPNTFRDLAKLITPRMQEKGLDFTYHIADDLPQTLYGDHANIKKIVTNFLSNAAKYTEKGFVRYDVSCINTGDNCRLIITVEDSGRGIKKENIDKLFTKFDRLDVDRNTTVEGTGLGLAITKQLVEMMGGKIVVHTVFGEGSKFTAMIDQKIDETPVEVIEVNKTIDLSKTKILLVDDNKLNLKVETKVLNRFNCTDIDLANDGYECIELVNKNKYDIILLDDMMPRMSGSETLKKLKEIDGFNTPVVALTANAITGMRESYIAQGFDEYLAKPLERDELIRVLNTLLFNTGAPTTSTFESNEEIKEEKSFEPDDSEKSIDDTVEIVTDDFIKKDESKIDDNSEVLEDVEPIKIEEPPKLDPVDYLRSNGVDMDKALELLGDMEMYNMTISDFSNELEDKWSRIEEEKLNGDMENYAIDVHSLKSDCKYLGFYDLADVAYEHELKSKEKNIDFVNENFERLEIEYEKVLNIVKNYIEKIKQ